MDIKDTGFIRTMDDLGRIVIPKTVRKDLNFPIINDYETFGEGCKFKIYVVDNKNIMLELMK